MLIAVLVGSTACRQTSREFRFPERQVGPHEAIATRIEYPDVASAMDSELAASQPPRATENPHDQEPLDLALPEAIQLAMIQNEVIRGLGGSVVAAPGGAQTVFQPALVESDPRASVEAALSAFDAQLTTSVFWNKIDRPVSTRLCRAVPLPVAQQL
jgi:hypothetical protein